MLNSVHSNLEKVAANLVLVRLSTEMRAESYLGCVTLKDPFSLPSLLDLPLNVTNGVTLHKLDREITQRYFRANFALQVPDVVKIRPISIYCKLAASDRPNIYTSCNTLQHCDYNVLISALYCTVTYRHLSFLTHSYAHSRHTWPGRGIPLIKCL